MKLAEALALRADAARRAEQLRARIAASARYQEGETPAEDAAALLAGAGEVLGELESLIRRINRTNAGTVLETGGTLTDALARRDVLRLRHTTLTGAAAAAAGDSQRGLRQLRSEPRMIPALPVADLRAQADDLARQLREVDTLIQRTAWCAGSPGHDKRVRCAIKIDDIEPVLTGLHAIVGHPAGAGHPFHDRWYGQPAPGNVGGGSITHIDDTAHPMTHSQPPSLPARSLLSSTVSTWKRSMASRLSGLRARRPKTGTV